MAEQPSNPQQTKQATEKASNAMSFGDRNRDKRNPRPTAYGSEEKQFDERTIQIDRVARVVMGGRRFRFRALVVAGDHKGSVGVGLAKGADVSTAISKATDIAKKNMTKVALYKGTLSHDIETKVGGAKVLLKPASAGTGLIAGGAVRTILEVTGITDALSKSLGSSNQVNLAYATVKALEELVPHKDWVTSINKSQSAKSNNKHPKATTAKSKGSEKK